MPDIRKFLSASQPSSSLSGQENQRDQIPQRPAIIVLKDQHVGSLTNSASEEPHITDCTHKCCDLSSVIPVRLTVDRSLTEHVSQNGKRKRNFNDKWLLTYSWLVICKSSGLAFCQTCRYAVKNKLFTPDKKLNAEETFVKCGFANWNKGKSKLDSHQRSAFHLDSSQSSKHLLRERSISCKL